MKWHPHLKFAMPGVIALFLASLFGRFIPYHLRVYVYISVIITLVLGLVTGQFHQMAQKQKKKDSQDQPRDPPEKRSAATLTIRPTPREW